MTVKELRASTGLSRNKFAKKYGIPFGSLGCWEYNQRNPLTYEMNLLERAVTGDLDVEKEVPTLSVVELRKRTGLTQTEFGDKYCVCLKTIQNWEYGRKKTSNWVLRYLTLAVLKDFPEERSEQDGR